MSEGSSFIYLFIFTNFKSKPTKAS